jgi:hypothetical protein
VQTNRTLPARLQLAASQVKAIKRCSTKPDRKKGETGSLTGATGGARTAAYPGKQFAFREAGNRSNTFSKLNRQ